MNKIIQFVKRNLAAIAFSIIICLFVGIATSNIIYNQILLGKEEIQLQKLCHPGFFVSKIKNTQNTIIICMDENEKFFGKLVSEQK